MAKYYSGISSGDTLDGMIANGGEYGINPSQDIDCENIECGIITAATGIFSGNVSIGGTLTYEDVKNVDSVGIVTAGKGVRVTTGGIVVTAGVSTFSGLVDINAGGQASTFKVEDLTAGRIVFSAAGGTLVDSSNLTFDGTTLTGTYFANFLQATELRVSSLFNVTGVSTFTSGLNVTGHTELDNVNVSGVATVVGTLTAGLIDGGSY